MHIFQFNTKIIKKINIPKNWKGNTQKIGKSFIGKQFLFTLIIHNTEKVKAIIEATCKLHTKVAF